MKKIGIIGGMSPESTLHYYKEINRRVNKRAGGHTSADLVLRSVNFQKYVQLMEIGDWDAIAELLWTEAYTLYDRDKCDYIAIATNTMHKVADKITGSHAFLQPGESKDVIIPLVHIGACIAEACEEQDIKRVAILGTKFTMTQRFMKDYLSRKGLEVVNAFKDDEIDAINRIIFDELCHGNVESRSKEEILNIMTRATNRDFNLGGTGIDGFIFGCTELDMIDDGEPYSAIRPQRSYKIISSTEAHINKLVELCLEE